MTGTVELLPAGSFGVDDSFQPPALDDMLALGVQFESRYIAIESDLTRPKLWTKDRIKRNADAGILAMVNYEQSQGTTLTGADGGRKHGQVAADWRAHLEMPADLAIVITTDVGVTSSQYPAIRDFCAAFKEQAGPIGHYHGTTLCADLEAHDLNDLTWMAMATSWSPGGETPAVHVRQKGYVLNGSCDANYVRQPTPFWNFNGTPIKPPEDPMSYTLFQLVDADAVFGGYWDGQIAQEIVHLDNPTFLHYRDDLHKEVRPTQLAELATVYLIGPLPQGDSRHEWTGAEFKFWAGGQGPKGDPGKDAPVPRSFTPVY